jgi:hypothetical protein
MPTFAKNCDIVQGFDFKKDKQTTVGFITALKIGDSQLEAKITVKDPTAPTTDLAVVAVLTNAMWTIGPTQPIYFSGQIDTKNKQKVDLLTIKDLSKIEVTYKFKVYSYDPVAKVYYLSMHSNDVELKGLVEKQGEALSLAADEEESTEVQSPKNFGFQIGITPAPTAQEIHLATSNTDKVASAWGIKNE